MTDNPFPSLEMIERASGRMARERLSTNENEFGPAPSVVRAIAAAASSAHRYPDCEHFALRARLGDSLGVSSEEVHVGPGIDGLLAAVCRGFLGPARRAVTSEATYPTFGYFARSTGTALHRIPFQGESVNVKGLVECAREVDADTVYVADPDNPTGSSLGRESILALADDLPRRTLLVIDGAYAEYQHPAERLAPRDVTGRRMLWLRTFSKAYALAGMRIGYGIGHPDLLEVLGHGAEHYVVGRLAEVAALAALDAEGHLATTIRGTAEGRTHYTDALEGLGLKVIPSSANFVTFRCPDQLAAAMLADALSAAGVFVRHLMAPTFKDCIRISIGPRPQRLAVLGLVTELFGDSKKVPTP